MGEVITRLGRWGKARAAYVTGIRRAKKSGHSATAEDLRLARAQLGGWV